MAAIDPYSRAWLALDGAAPLGSGEGVSFVAREDQSGARLDARCDYIIAGAAPPARVWTLTVYDVNGRLRRSITAAGAKYIGSPALELRFP